MEEGGSGGSGGSDSSTSGSGGAQQRELERMAEVLVTGEQLRLRLHEEKVIKDRRHHLKTYPNCFVAKELIDWLIEHKEASDRETAVKLMQKLADRGIIHHVCDEHKEFKDVKLFYRFRKDDGTFPLDNEVKAFMRGQRLYEKLMSPENTLLQPREEEGVKYERTFMASEFLDWLVQEGEATSRKEAEQLCHRLMEHGIIQHVSNKHPFVDSNLLYQFRMNFRRRRRLMELLNEKSPSSQETHDSPFCLRKQSHDNRKSTSFMSVSPSKEIKIVSAVRRSSMSSCGSSGYFSSSPTLSSSPPVLCNPKSGEWPKGSPLSGGDGGGRGRGAGGVPRAAHSRMGRLLCGNLVTACSWGQRTSNGREACRFAQRENQAAPWTPRGALELGWPFRVVPAWGLLGELWSWDGPSELPRLQSCPGLG
ncbi:DEP domain-containing mTOR-interacting protein isoform X1 [Ursus arctos]|uniref:DEP domain-containing mTOR-interacting protein isoform X1 n=1 Tax=Ursus arctos TaxID=9644 RepID=UPI00254676B4|nr:DEP domain-containing mTOR-interacting protein isoform X1 [Ursus arctos]